MSSSSQNQQGPLRMGSIYIFTELRRFVSWYFFKKKHNLLIQPLWSQSHPKNKKSPWFKSQVGRPQAYYAFVTFASLTLSEVEAAQQSLLDKSKHNDPELMYISLQLHQWAVTRAFLQWKSLCQQSRLWNSRRRRPQATHQHFSAPGFVAFPIPDLSHFQFPISWQVFIWFLARAAVWGRCLKSSICGLWLHLCWKKQPLW